MVLVKNRVKSPLKLRKIIAIIVIIFLVIIIGFLTALPYMMFGSILGKHIERQQYTPEEFGIQAERIELITQDNIKLASWLIEADSPKGTVIVLSGIENPSITAFFGYAKMFKENGYNSLLIEMRARNASEGEQIGFAFEEWMDVKAGVEYIKGDIDLSKSPIVAMGTSMGGASVINAAGEISDIDAVISCSSFSSWSDVFYDNMVMMDVPSFVANAERPFVSLFFGINYGFDNLKYSPIKQLEKIGDRPILLMHSTEDTQVPYPSYTRLLEKAKSINANVYEFVREGDYHFICYDDRFENPEKDTEFSQALIQFLENNL